MWLYDIRDAFKVKEKRTLLLWCGVIGNVIILGIASFLLVGGTYGSVCVAFRLLLPERNASHLRALQSLDPRRICRVGWPTVVVRRQLGLSLSEKTMCRRYAREGEGRWSGVRREGA